MVKLAELQDIEKYTPDHKIDANDANTASWQIEATRIIKSWLSGTFTAVELHSWQDPDSTPPIIRSIAGELIAAYFYRALYSEDETTIPLYAQTLYNEAIAMLQQIKDGTLQVLDEDDNPIGDVTTTNMGTGDFYPDSTAPGPYFKMNDSWA
jgi:hypothetical protein